MTPLIIDVSKWQGIIDWPKVKMAGVESVKIRATMGGSGLDYMYRTNWARSRDVGIPDRGPYHYVTTSVMAADQVNNILRTTGGDFGSAITLDCERTDAEREASAAGWVFPKAEYTSRVRAMIDLLEARGAKVEIYTSKREWEAITTQPSWAKNYPLHVAAYPLDPNDPFYRPPVPIGWPWTLWQYTFQGHVDGILGNVDMSRRNLTPAPNPDIPRFLTKVAELRTLIQE
jgi:Lyzozyme M1 (1,4-beta-N-acetylmuramidase)